ncbi:AbiU2 domain-containing protein [Leptospira sp. GIMC2001]|uniref:AbiU2 domain-containing protein n=1 Tax=Leptospira sp. GIMC2001 TaxID=1513297 RepID=UPI0023491FB8|nr:hypothetical protein [Leptospira sp. GIMC2001]WCL51017.1 hypothetical protein O4O04_09455 [Leptospira sp. GIMC2001]
MTTIEQYIDSIEIYSNILFSKISLKLAIFKGFEEKLKNNFKELANISPIFPFITESLHVDCVISISKLIEGKRSKNTIQMFMKFISENKSEISKKYPDLTIELIENHEKILTKIQREITNILHQRDKYFAHSDNEYFNLQGKLLHDFPETYDNLTIILNTLISIITDHRFLIKKSYPVNMSDFAYAHVERMYHLILESSEQ